MDRSDRAVERKHALGINCCQAVLLEFVPEILKHWGLRPEAAAAENSAMNTVTSVNPAMEALMALGSGFGGGMGCGDATCGALVGAGMVAGLLNSRGCDSPVAAATVQSPAASEASDSAASAASASSASASSSSSAASPDNQIRRMPTTVITKDMCKEFKDRVGALRCSDIKGFQVDPSTGKIVRGKVLCSCDDCVRHAVNLCARYVFNN
jgi:hypothetical protein